MRKIFFFIPLLLITLSLSAQQPMPFVTAHGGCWTKDIPANSPEAMSLAKKMGFRAVSIDTKQAADADIKKMLKICKKNSLMPMIESDRTAVFKLAQKTMGNRWICLTSTDSMAKKVRSFSKCEILVNMDNVTPQDAVKRLSAIGLPCGLSTTRPESLSKSLCLQLRANGFETQAVLFKPAYEVQATLQGITRTLSDYAFPYTTNINPTDNWAVTGQVMEAKDELNKQWDKYQHGGLVLRFWFRGAIMVIVNGEKKYSLVSNGDSMQYISTRFTDTAPSIRIIASTDTQLAEMEASLYTIE